MNIIRPTLLVDELKCRAHIDRMRLKGIQSNVIFRPHFKTHQSQAIGKWYREAGISKITTSSLEMAEYFAADGWEDITVAFPVNYLEHALINSLAEKIQLNLCTVSLASLEKLAEKLEQRIHIFIEIDSGYGRTGIEPTDFDTIDLCIRFIEHDKHMSFAGFLSHAGQSYKSRSKEEIKEVHASSFKKAIALKEKYLTRFPNLVCSVGDTPTCSVVDDFTGVDEIRPGNFVFYDVMQSEIGSCSIDAIAVVLACPVVALHETKNEIVVHGGAVQLSKDSVLTKAGKQIFGRLAIISETDWRVLPETFYVKSISQEHGVISFPSTALERFKIGDIVGILPIHSCLTADCMGGYTTLTGKKLDHYKLAIR